MSTAVATTDSFIPHASAPSRTALALQSLMTLWEEDVAVEDQESEAELMVMLSGMVGVYATSLEDR